jgi:ATP-dependent 26S proteasome regulatory subunit
MPADHGEAFALLEDALAAHAARFGERPAVWQFLGHVPKLLELVHEAVERGVPLGEAETYRRLGIASPPSDAEL